ncbi:MAG: VWA domain-containing protein [Myxococcales bacterium]|nr:VWA domain-containing protein [Myxococcales bacterium]
MTIALRGAVHGNVAVVVPADVSVGVQVTAPTPPPPPPPPPEPVAIVGAPIVEFFGVPLEGAQDVVFVLDCSGSMLSPAQGRLATIAVPMATALPPAPPPPPPAPPPLDPSAPAVIPGYPAGQQPPPPPPPPVVSQPPPPPVISQPPPPPAAPIDVAVTPPPAPPVAQATTKFDIAQSELVDALRRLPDGTRINVIFFNSELEAVSPVLVTLQASDRDPLTSFVLDKQADGSTALTPAMRMAFLMNARRIVLLSDGLGNVGGSGGALLRDAREAVRGGVRIDTIGLGADQDRHLLHALAAESGGLYQAL